MAPFPRISEPQTARSGDSLALNDRPLVASRHQKRPHTESQPGIASESGFVAPGAYGCLGARRSPRSCNSKPTRLAHASSARRRCYAGWRSGWPSPDSSALLGLLRVTCLLWTMGCASGWWVISAAESTATATLYFHDVAPLRARLKNLPSRG